MHDTPIPHNPPQPPIPPGQYGMLPPPAPGVPGPRPHMPSQFQRARPRTGLWRSLGLVLFVGVIGFNLLLFLGMFGAVGMLGGGQRDPHGVHETTRESGTSSKIAVIPVDGVIMEGGQGGLFGGAGVDPVSLVEDGLRRARNDDKVVAVILQVNSPGGGVTASDYIHDAIKRFRADTGKPVVVFMKDLAASGGYYVAAPADYIVASPTTLTGSIGVIIQSVNFHGTLTEVIRARDMTVKAGKNKSMGSPFADPESEDAREGRRLLQELVDEMHTRFKRLVKEGRKDRLVNDWENYADGRIMSADQAKTLGFIDRIGYFEDAIEEAERLSGVRNAEVVEYGRKPRGLAALFGMQGEDSKPQTSLGDMPGATADALAARMQQLARFYPGRPLAIWAP